MSLTRLLKIPEASRFFAEHVRMPARAIGRPMVAPPVTDHYPLVGTAFDYLLRFMVQRWNPGTLTRAWVAESLLSSPASPILEDAVYDSRTRTVASYKPTPLTRKVQETLRRARENHSLFLSSGEFSPSLLRSCLSLARLEHMSRGGRPDPNLGDIDEGDVRDLLALARAVPTTEFRATRFSAVNPSFGSASRLVGGADADIVLDQSIVDIKTTRKDDIERPVVHHWSAIASCPISEAYKTPPKECASPDWGSTSPGTASLSPSTSRRSSTNLSFPYWPTSSRGSLLATR